MKPCNGCGRCCINYTEHGTLGGATDADLANWKFFDPLPLEWTDEFVPDLWLDPETGDDHDGRCPFLQKRPRQNVYKCQIYHVRPYNCDDYPVSVRQMLKDGCEMLEASDYDRSLEDLERDLKVLKAKAGEYLPLLTAEEIPLDQRLAIEELLESYGDAVRHRMPLVVYLPKKTYPFSWEFARIARYSLGSAIKPLVLEPGKDENLLKMAAKRIAKDLEGTVPDRYKTSRGFLRYLTRKYPKAACQYTLIVRISRDSKIDLVDLEALSTQQSMILLLDKGDTRQLPRLNERTTLEATPRRTLHGA